MNENSSYDSKLPDLPLPCKLCGSKAHCFASRLRIENEDTPQEIVIPAGDWSVGCTYYKCGVQGKYYSTREVAIEKWNKQA